MFLRMVGQYETQDSTLDVRYLSDKYECSPLQNDKDPLDLPKYGTICGR